MPRNGAGSYVLPQAPFSPQTPILSAAVNSDFADIATALTGSLARDGQGGMLAVLKLDNAGFTFLSDPDTGRERTGANAMADKAGNVTIAEYSSTGVNFPLGASIAGVSIGLPAGVILPYGGSTVPAGFLFPVGQAVSRTGYPALFAAIGILYGAGDGSTTFNLPDLRGSVLAGKDDMGGTAAGRLTNTTMTPDGNTLGARGGAQTKTLLTTNLPPYTPSGAVNLGLVGAINFTGAATAASGFGVNAVGAGTTNVNFTGSTAQFVGQAQGGTSTPVNSIQPTLITNFIIKT